MAVFEAEPTTSRLLRGVASGRSMALAQHLAAHGPLPVPARQRGHRCDHWAEGFLAEVECSGLTGRGGAGFPSAKKARAVRAADAHPVLLVNAMEGEPASAKDRLLLSASPHLVLDGAELLARALSASEVVVCLPVDREGVARAVLRALGERPVGDGAVPRVEFLAPRYTAGEESALSAAVAGRPAVPAFRPDKSVPLPIGRHRALVHNTETLGHLALIGRYGHQWFRELGVPEAPGTCLVTVSGGVARPGVLEVEVGTSVIEMVEAAGGCDGAQAVLVGGYGGTWLTAAQAGGAYAPAPLKALGASMGAGVIAVLPDWACGLRETERVVRFMASESAGQCGPCVFGLPAVADDLARLADGKGDERTLQRLSARCRLVAGRGACRHPDGVSRLVSSALRVFEADLRAHLRSEPCPGSWAPTVLRFPRSSAPSRAHGARI